jgi:hypothetical protein
MYVLYCMVENIAPRRTPAKIALLHSHAPDAKVKAKKTRNVPSINFFISTPNQVVEREVQSNSVKDNVDSGSSRRDSFYSAAGDPRLNTDNLPPHDSGTREIWDTPPWIDPRLNTRNLPPHDSGPREAWDAPPWRINTRNLPPSDSGPRDVWDAPPWQGLRINTRGLPLRDQGEFYIEKEILTNGFVEGAHLTWDSNWVAPWDGKTYGSYDAAKKSFEAWSKLNKGEIDEFFEQKRMEKEAQEAQEARDMLYTDNLRKNPPPVLPQELKKNKYPGPDTFEFDKSSKKAKGVPDVTRSIRRVPYDLQTNLKNLRDLRAKRRAVNPVVPSKPMNPIPPKISTHKLDIHKKGPHIGKRIKSDSNYIYKTPEQKIKDADKPMPIPSKRSERIAKKRAAGRPKYKKEKKQK